MQSSWPEAPLTRRVRRNSSLDSALPHITSRRDSLFGNAGNSSDEEDSLPPPPGVPRRKFARRNAFCHFQLVQDAVHATIDLNSLALSQPFNSPHDDDDNFSYEVGNAFSTETHGNEAGSPDFCSHHRRTQQHQRRRKVSLPMITENDIAASAASLPHQDSAGAAGGTSSSSRKMSRTCYRHNPSADSLYSEESTLL